MFNVTGAAKIAMSEFNQYVDFGMGAWGLRYI